REVVEIDHQLQRLGRPPAHHLLQQFSRHFLVATRQHHSADFVENVLCIEHQPVEVENNGSDSRYRFWHFAWEILDRMHGEWRRVPYHSPMDPGRLYPNYSARSPKNP